MTSVSTTCPYCGVGCGVVAEEGGLRVVGDQAHPANEGKLCSKGSALAETLFDQDRLLRPRVDGFEASWNVALDRIAGEFAATIAAHGPDSVAFYVSGQCLTEDYYVANKLMKGFIGAANIDTNSRLCMASSVAGHVRGFGADVVPGVYEDWDQSDLAILVGSNAAWCHPVLFQRLQRSRDQRGTKLVVIDPRRTANCEAADLHLALKPGSDVALFAGLLAYLEQAGAIADGWVQRHASGLDAALATARETAGSLEQVAAITGLEVAEIAQFYRWFAATERSLTIYSQGVNQSSAGTDKVNAILNCHLATGRIGRPGMGPFSVTGQPNAMGGREVGGLANQLAAHMSFADPAAIDRVARFWNVGRMATGPGLKAVDLFDAVQAGKVKAVWVMATNPAASMPRAGAVRAALEACPFVVVSELWASADTARYADVLLPAAGWGEKDGTVTNSERCISRQRAFRPAPGEAKADWWAMAQVAQRMGWGDAFAYANSADIFREHAALSGFENDGRRVFDIGALAGISDADYDALEPFQWPLPAGSMPARGPLRLFAEGGFPTADGRARLIPTAWRGLESAVDEDRPLLLNTGRLRDQWHTMTRTGRVARLMSHSAAPFLAIHPDDATAAGIRSGDLVRVANQHGELVLPAKVTEAQRIGELFAPMHWTDAFSSSGPIGQVVTSAVDPVSGQPELKATPVSVAPVTVAWRALLLRRTCHARPRLDLPAGMHWVRIPTEHGEAFEIAGEAALPGDAELADFMGGLVGHEAGAEWLDYADPARGNHRCATLIGGHLQACLFVVTGRGRLPNRDSLDELLGEGAAADEIRIAVLAGRRATSGKRSDGPTVCTCYNVGLATLQAAIRDDHLTTVAQVGTALRAGTNCGSCVSEIKELLRHAHAELV